MYTPLIENGSEILTSEKVELEAGSSHTIVAFGSSSFSIFADTGDTLIPLGSIANGAVSIHGPVDYVLVRSEAKQGFAGYFGG